MAFVKELNKTVKHEVTVIPIIVGILGTFLNGLRKKSEGTGNQRYNRDHTDHNIIEIG